MMSLDYYSVADALQKSFEGPSIVPLDRFVGSRMSTGDITAFEELVEKVNEVIYALRDDPVVHSQPQVQEQPRSNFNLMSGRLVAKAASNGMRY